MKLKNQITFLLLSIICISLSTSCGTGRMPASSEKNNTIGTIKDANIIGKYANILGVKPGDLRNLKLYGLIDDWIGTPYRYGGTTKTGVDCSGFVNQIYKNFTAQSLPRRSADLAKVIKPVNLKNLKEGDLVFFDYDAKNSHVGIYLINGRYVHASTKSGVTISNLNDAWNLKQFSTGGPLKNVQLK